MANKTIELCGITFENAGKVDKVRVIPGRYAWDAIYCVYGRASESED